MSTAQERVSAEPLIQVRQLSKSYQQGGRARKILDAVDLDIHSGELVILLGRSGSGKSTLLNLLAGLDSADSGELTVAGQQLSRANELERTLFRREKLGVVFQFFNLIPTLTVEENALLRVELNRRSTPQVRSTTRELLAEVGLGDRLKSWPDELSGGEQQRVAIVAALAHDPQIVLADEPTGNLDLETGTRITELLDRLTRRLGKTLIMATHAREVMGLADSVYSIRDGRLIEEER